MKYVLDSSVALKFVLPEPDSDRAIQLRDEFRHGILHLIAPDIFTSEVANGLATAERQGRTAPGEAILFLHDVIQNSPVIYAPNPFLPRAIDLSIIYRHAVYDCIYLALAEAENCEMVSADDAFVRKMRSNFPYLIRLADLP